MNKLLVGLLCAGMMGCVNATANDTVGDTETLNFAVPALPISICSTLSQTTPSFNLSDFFTQLKKQGDLSVNFTQSALTGNLEDFKHATLSLVSANGSSTLLADQDFTPVNGTVNLKFLPTNQTLVNLLSAGPVQVQVDLTACNTKSGTQQITYTLAADANFSYNKGL